MEEKYGGSDTSGGADIPVEGFATAGVSSDAFDLEDVDQSWTDQEPNKSTIHHGISQGGGVPEANPERECTTSQDILSSRRTRLLDVVSRSFVESSHQSRGFALRLHGGTVAGHTWQSVSTADLTYGGYPPLAYQGYAVASGTEGQVLQEFLERMRQVLTRPGGTLDQLVRDDVALLGLADGLAAVRFAGHEVDPDVSSLLEVIEQSHGQPLAGQRRLRLLAAELLDPRGRLQARPSISDVDGGAIELALRQTWSGIFGQTPGLAQKERERLLNQLLCSSPPEVGELERAAYWLRSLDGLIAGVARELTPSEDDVVKLLRRTQTGLKRWVMEHTQRRGASVVCQWWIDNEYHVQSMLWAVLYPVFGGDLLDEEYVPSAGMKRPRVDLCIPPLRLIIEVKFVRRQRDFAEVEEQVAGDLGVYFTDPRFDRLIVYVYDDTEQGHPEEHGRLRDALMNRDPRMVDVVVVQRPGHILARSQRKEAPS